MHHEGRADVGDVASRKICDDGRSQRSRGCAHLELHERADRHRCGVRRAAAVAATALCSHWNCAQRASDDHCGYDGA